MSSGARVVQHEGLTPDDVIGMPKPVKPPRIKRKQTKMQYPAATKKFKASWFRRLMTSLTGRQFQYQVTIRYNYEQDRDGFWPDSKYVSRTINVGLTDPRVLHFNHHLNKELSPMFIKQIPRHLLRNGLVQITNVNFLGVW